MTAQPRLGWIARAFALGALVAAASGASKPGSITGTVDEPGVATVVTALDRTSGKSYPGTLEAGSGRFTIGGLPTGSRYDCVIDFRDKARLEGVDLKVPPSEYVEEQPLSTEDVETIKGQVRALNKFEDEVDVLAVVGNIEHAAVVVNKLRTRSFVNSKPGEVVWRAELWRFERPEETWLKVQDELFLVLYRERLSKEDYAKKAITFDAALGGIAVNGEHPKIDLGQVKRPSAAPGIRLRAETTKRPGPGGAG